MLGQPFCPVHGDHGLACACTAQYADRAVPVALDELSLGGMQEDSPFFERSVQDCRKLQLVFDDEEAAPGIFVLQGGGKIGRIYRMLRGGLFLQLPVDIVE